MIKKHQPYGMWNWIPCSDCGYKPPILYRHLIWVWLWYFIPIPIQIYKCEDCLDKD